MAQPIFTTNMQTGNNEERPERRIAKAAALGGVAGALLRAETLKRSAIGGLAGAAIAGGAQAIAERSASRSGDDAAGRINAATARTVPVGAATLAAIGAITKTPLWRRAGVKMPSVGGGIADGMMGLKSPAIIRSSGIGTAITPLTGAGKSIVVSGVGNAAKSGREIAVYAAPGATNTARRANTVSPGEVVSGAVANSSIGRLTGAASSLLASKDTGAIGQLARDAQNRAALGATGRRDYINKVRARHAEQARRVREESASAMSPHAPEWGSLEHIPGPARERLLHKLRHIQKLRIDSSSAGERKAAEEAMARVKKTYGLSAMNTQPRQILEGIIELSFLNRIKEKADELAPVIQKKIGKFNAIQERFITGKSAFPRVSKARAKEMYREVAGGKLPDDFDITAVKGGSHFNPGTSAGGSAMRSSPTAEIIAHEAGHARQARIAKVLAYRAAKKAGVPAHEAIAIAKNAPAAVFAGTNYAKQIPTKTKAGAVIASLPNLAIEADASRRAVKHLGKDAIPSLARAWSTYAAGAASKIRKAGRVEMSAREELISIIEFGASSGKKAAKKLIKKVLKRPELEGLAERADELLEGVSVSGALGSAKKKYAPRKSAAAKSVNPAQDAAPQNAPQQTTGGEAGYGRFVPKKVRAFFTGENETLPPVIEETVRKVAAHPAAKVAGIDGEAILKQGRKIAQAKAGEINRKILVWSVVPPAIQYGISKRDSNKSERNIINAVKQGQRRDFRSELDGIITFSGAWTRKEGKSRSGGLNEKGRKSYERENPGSDLKAPSKEAGNPRRASFCARMKGMKKKLTSSKTASDPDSRINKSLRAWNCSAREALDSIIAFADPRPHVLTACGKKGRILTGREAIEAIMKTPGFTSSGSLQFADPRPRNSLGMFSGADGSGIDPEAIGTVYKQGAQVAQQEESALAGIARKLKGKKIRMSASESLDEIRFARGDRAIRQIWPVTEHEKMAMFNKVPVFAKSRKMLADRLRAELPDLRKAMAYQKDELRATGYTGKFHWGARESLDSIINFAKGDFLMRTMKKVGVSTPRAELDAIEAAGRGVQGAFNQAATGAGRADLAGADTIGKVRSHLAGQLNEARKATRNAPFKKPVAERPIAPNSGTAPDPRLKTAASYGNTPVGQTGSSVQPVNPAPYQQPVAKQPVAQEAVAQQAAQKQAEEMAGGAVKQPTAMSGPNLKYRLRGWRGASLAGAAGLGAGYALGGGSSNV